MIKACIFDLDGTVLYTLESIARAGNKMLEQLGFPVQPVDDYRFYCGNGADKLVERLLKKTGGMNPENYSCGCLLNRRFLAEAPLYRVHPYEGMTEALKELKRRGILLAVFSNKPDGAAKDAIEGSYGAGLFDLVRGQKKDVPMKPAPDGALEIAGELGCLPCECLYFGDTGTDMQTGKNDGMKTVGVLWGYRGRKELEENQASCIISKPSEIPGLLSVS